MILPALIGCGGTHSLEDAADQPSTPAGAEHSFATVIHTTPASGTSVPHDEWETKVSEVYETRISSVPLSCPVTTWQGPDARLIHQGEDYAYWLGGTEAGLALGEQSGVLTQGWNKISWLVYTDVSTSDAVSGEISVVGIPFGEDSDRIEFDHNVIVQVPVYRGVRADDVKRAWIAEVDVPSAGCWEIRAKIGSDVLEAIVYAT